MRAMQSDYMHWAKFKPSVRYGLTGSEVQHFRLDRFPISIAELDLDGASYPRYAPLRERIAHDTMFPLSRSSPPMAPRWPIFSRWPR